MVAPSVSRRRAPACMRCKRSCATPGNVNLAMSVAINEGIAKGGAGRHRLDAMRDSRDDSLRFMRERMFRDQKFEAGVMGWKASSMSSTYSPS